MLDQFESFFSFSTHKLEESVLFYRDILGLDVELIDDRFIHLHLGNRHPAILYFKPDHKAPGYTVLNFQVQDIEVVVDGLIAKGVVFEQYEAPIKTDKKGISWDENGSHIAWFWDPGGNILALIEN